MPKTTFKKWFLIMLMFLITTIAVLSFFEPKKNHQRLYKPFITEENDYEIKVLVESECFHNYSHGKWRSMSEEQQGNLSQLGRILFLDEKPRKMTLPLKKFTILFWKYRNSQRYRSKIYKPFEGCSVQNCRVKYSSSSFSLADIIIFDLNKTKNINQLPLHKKRNPRQIWTFFTDQSPLAMFSLPYHTQNFLTPFNNIFNWSMTYRMDSDIPVPYGRTLLLNTEENGLVQKYAKWNRKKKQNVLVAALSSNCQGKNNRWDYVKKLQSYIDIDVYGECGPFKCILDLSNTPSYLTQDCKEISNYKFYLAFESANCDEYITEKLWWYGLTKNAIPIVMGASIEGYDQLLPPYSYINIERFAGPRDLANYIMYLNRTPSHIIEYFSWKQFFKVVKEHGYFNTKSVHYCRICEALNYNSMNTKVYSDLNRFWGRGGCHPNWNSH